MNLRFSLKNTLTYVLSNELAVNKLHTIIQNFSAEDFRISSCTLANVVFGMQKL